MEQRKRGRPKKQDDMYEMWEHKYYSLSEKNNSSAIKRTVKERLLNGYSSLFTLAHNREPDYKETKYINRLVTDILDSI